MKEREEQSGELEREIGLCAECEHRRTQTTRRGSRFYRCARADRDPRFLRYPPIPVSRCPGYEPPPSHSGGGRTSKQDT